MYYDDWCPSPEEILRICARNVLRSGWHVSAVYADPETGAPGFAYTTGLWATWQHPELVIVAVPPAVAHGLFSEMAAAISAGTRFSDGGQYEGVANMPLRIRAVDRSRCVLGFGITDVFYGRPGAPAPFRQVVWPDPAGHFPGDPECEPAMALVQDIGLPPAGLLPPGR